MRAWLIALLVLLGLIIVGVVLGTLGVRWHPGFNDIINVTDTSGCKVPKYYRKDKPPERTSMVGAHPIKKGQSGLAAAATAGQDLTSVASGSKEVSFNGRYATIGEEPWVVAIGYQSWPSWKFRWGGGSGDEALRPHEIVTTSCTGVIVGPQWILTAAHCLEYLGSRYWVTAGVDCRPEFGGILLPGAQRRVVDQWYRRTPTRLGWSWENKLPILKETSGDPSRAHEDVALLHLKTPLDLDERPLDEDNFQCCSLASKWRTDPVSVYGPRRDEASPPALPRAIPIAQDCNWPNERAEPWRGVVASGWGLRQPMNPTGHLLSIRLAPPKNFSHQEDWPREPIFRRWGLRTLDEVDERVRPLFESCSTTAFCAPVYDRPDKFQTCMGDSGGPWARYGPGGRVDLIGIVSRSILDPNLIEYNQVTTDMACGWADYDIAVRVCDSESRQWIKQKIGRLEAKLERRQRSQEGGGRGRGRGQADDQIELVVANE